jgi:hypothetical protein
VDPAILAAPLAWLSALVVGTAGGLWFRRLRAVRVPEDRTGFLAAFGAGGALAVAAFVLGPGWLAGVAAGLALLGSVTFLGLNLQSTQADRTPRVAVGGPILDFSAPDADGAEFQLAQLRGKPFLLKFFRGHW